MAVTFREIAAERMAAKRLRLAPRSLRTDQQRLAPLLEAFGELPAAEISPASIDEFLAGLVTDGRRSRSTANRYHSLLSSIFSLATRNGRIPANPLARVSYLKENPPRVRFLTDDEEAALRSAIRRRCPAREPEFDLALSTGMRRGEQFTLRRDAVNLELRILTVWGKTGRRYIPLNAAARAALAKLLGACPGEFVCPEAKRAGQRDERRWFEPCVNAAGIADFHWHDLRHTFASRLAMAGVPLRTIQELLGHRAMRMTERYAHLDQAHLQAAVDVLARGTQEKLFG